MPRLLLRPYSRAAHRNDRSSVSRSRRFARRLEEQVAWLKSGGLKHLARLSIGIAELQCGYDPEEVLRHVRAGFGADLEFAELDKLNISLWPKLPPVQTLDRLNSGACTALELRLPGSAWRHGVRRLGL